MSTKIIEGSLVTVKLQDGNNASNTYKVFRKLEGECILEHPLAPGSFIIKKDSELNGVLANLKNSTERSLEFAKNNKEFLDYNTYNDLLALCLYFVVHKKLTGRQKKSLSNVCGSIAVILFENNLSRAIKVIKDNEGILDEFNYRWYSTFEKLFNDPRLVKSKKQRASIFNIAGFVLAELASQTAEKN